MRRISNHPLPDLQAEIDRLHGLAAAAAEAKVRAGIGSLLLSTTWAPSRLQKSRRKRRYIEDAIASVEERELELRQPQIRWLERKLRRRANDHHQV